MKKNAQLAAYMNCIAPEGLDLDCYVEHSACLLTPAEIASLEPDLPGLRDKIAALEAGDATALGAALANNMTACAIALVPEVADALAWVSAESGVLGAAVSGSGSCVFALCADAGVAQRIAGGAPARGLWGAATATRLSGVTWG